MRFRNICYTCFDLLEMLSRLDEINNITVYHIFQVEECPTTSQIHFQGYIELKEQMSLKKIQEFFGSKIHVESRKGSQKEAIDYCKKQESQIDGPFEYGEPRRQGERSDITHAYDVIKTTKDLSQVEPSLIVKYGKALQHALVSTIPPRTKAPKTTIWIGTNSMDFIAFHYTNDTFIYNEETGWNGYNGQRTVIYNSLLCTDPLYLISQYPYMIKVLYDTCQFNSKYIHFICSELMSRNLELNLYNIVYNRDGLPQILQEKKIHPEEKENNLNQKSK